MDGTPRQGLPSMSLFRKKPNAAAPALDIAKPLAATISASVVLADGSERPTAGEATRAVWPHIASWGPDARLFLIISDSVGADGRSSEWQFHALYPTLRAEAVWKVHRSPDQGQLVGSYRMVPVPEPGSSEYLLAQVSPQMAVDQVTAWQDRLSLIQTLPHQFYDSSEAAAEFQKAVPNPFGSGAIRLKARRLPTGQTVWESRGIDLHQFPFGVSGVNA